MSTGFDVQLSSFFSEDTDRIVGILAEHIPQAGHRSMFTAQLSVWREEIKILKEQLKIVEASIPDSKSWHLIFEYELPRRQKRPDLIILTGHLILVVEFKIGPTSYDIASVWQALDYALNIRDFHEASAGHAIVPIVCIADAEETNRFPILSSATMIESPRLSNRNNLGRTIAEIYRSACSPQSQKTIDPAQWISSRYRPTLTIIEAAEHLYEDHDVREISHKYAENLDKTTDMLAAQIQAAKQNNKRCICFVTGVPGAGKTLTGLNVVHDPSIREKQGPAGIFLSGNGPLVKVVRESLIRSQQKKGVPKTKAKHEVSVFIRNVHEFLKYHRENPSQKPYEHVVVFDEAQRAWNREQMLRKQNIDCSEPSELLEVMERLDSWSAVIALVGGGQEIFTGEAGLEEWGMAIENAKEHWEIVASPEVIKGGSSVAGHRLFANEKPESIRYHLEESAHLNVSVRSHRAQQINEWVNSLLALDIEKAARHIPDPSEFPLVMTRNLELAKRWLKNRSQGDIYRRCGLVAPSGDQRFRAYGIEASSAFQRGYDYTKWFLAESNDVRSSFFLEVAASEFECQGLELDWVGMCWGGDLTLKDESQWTYRNFSGSKWQQCKQKIKQDYILNRYRVLLTRARSGMVIWIPEGSIEDDTRNPVWFNEVYDLLLRAGVQVLMPDDL